MARILYHHRIRADDGQAVHVRELIGALRRQGHEVLECALLPKAGDRVPEAGNGTPSARDRVLVLGEPVPEIGNSRGLASRFWQGLRLPRGAQEALEILYNYRAVRRLVKAAASFQPDLIYERHALHCWAGVEAARRLGVPLFLEVNAPLCDEMEELGLLRYPKNARRTERRVLAEADRVLAVSSVLRDRLEQSGAVGSRLAVVGNAAQPGRYGEEQRRQALDLRSELGLDRECFVLGFSGFVRFWHRLDLALDAMALLPTESLHLLVLGTGPAMGSLLQKARQMGLSHRLHALGEVPEDALPTHVCAFDAALVTAINSYASPLKLFEALAAGVVTIAPRQDNITEVIEDGKNGVLFEAGNPRSLADCLQTLVADRSRTRSLGDAGRETLVENDWTWDGNARRVMQAFEELVR